MRSANPRRISPAAAKMIAAYWPSSSLRNRVSTLPRNGSTCKCLNRARNWLSRRKLDVPTTAPLGKSSSDTNWLETNASRASSRAPAVINAKPAGNCAGTSFIECTAISASPRASACSSSLMNSPLPPTLFSVRSRIWSPRVVMAKIDTSHCGYNVSRRSRT